MSGSLQELGPTLLESLARFKWLVLGMTVLFGVVGFAISSAQPKAFAAEIELLLSDPRGEAVFEDSTRLVTNPTRYTRNQAQVMQSRDVAERASELLGGAVTPDEIIESIEATPVPEFDVVTLRAERRDSAEASAVAGAVAEAYRQGILQDVRDEAKDAIDQLLVSKAEVQTRIRELEQRLAEDPDDVATLAERDGGITQLVTLDSRIEQISVNAALYSEGVKILEPGDSASQVAPTPRRDAALSALLGLVLASAFAWWRADTVPIANDRRQPEQVLGAPLLGEIPVFGKVERISPQTIMAAPDSPAAAAYHFALTALGHILDDQGYSVIAVTSARPGDGKSVTVVNMALAAAADGRRSLIIDADERARGLSLLADHPNGCGLTDLAADPNPDLESCVWLWTISNTLKVNILSAGERPEDTAGFFRTTGFRKIMAQVRSHADVTFVDTPPALAAAETTDIAAHSDGVLVVVDHGTPLHVLSEVRERITLAGRPIVGYVFNRARAMTGQWRYGYGYGTGRTYLATRDGDVTADRAT